MSTEGSKEVDDVWAKLRRQKEAQKTEEASKTAEKVETVSSASSQPSPPVVIEQKVEKREEVTAETSKETPITVSPSSSPSPPVQIPKTLPVQPLSTEGFDDSPAADVEGLVIMDYGDKGVGKTALLGSLKGRIAFISYDQQTQPIYKEFFPSVNITTENMVVFDAVRYYSEEDPQIKLDSAVRSLNYLLYLIDGDRAKNIEGAIRKFAPDWIVIDGSEVMNQICEMVMRARNNVAAFEGFKNLNLWKERNMYINQIHRKLVGVAKKGVVYTSYFDLQIIKDDKTGETRKQQPKWIGDIKMKTRIVIKCSRADTKDGIAFYATVESSKDHRIPTCTETLVGQVDKNGNIEFKGIKALFREDVKA